MKQKRFFILAYAKANLGDDLFIYMLLKEYPNIQFYIDIENDEHSKLFQNFSNITILKEKEKNLTKQNAKDYDGYIYIGGSIFMEGGVVYNISEQFLEFMKECKENDIPFHYISSNFGPYYTQQYLDLAKEVYKNCSSICFRDKYSANLFSGIEQVHYAPDFAFLYSPKNTQKEPNTVGISIIDLSIRKKLLNYEQTYYEMLKNNICDYIEKGKNITLFSFCKYEGDERAIVSLLETIPNEISKKIKVVKYDGNIEYFLEEYSKMEYMICARFHAMILSVIMNQKCEIMSYSDKIDNVINDLQLFSNNIVHFNDITNKTKMPLEDFKSVEAEKIKQIANKAKMQLNGLNESLKE